MSQIPAVRSVEFAGLIYPNRIRIPEVKTYSYTTFVSQNQRNSVSIEFDKVLSPRMVEPSIAPRIIHSHGLGLELGFSDQDVTSFRELAERASRQGRGPPYGQFLYSVQAGDVKAQTMDILNGPITTSIIGQVEPPIKLNMFEDGGSPAAGGFLLYPNRPNNNQMRSVYAK
jgi:hypothetical protein